MNYSIIVTTCDNYILGLIDEDFGGYVLGIDAYRYETIRAIFEKQKMPLRKVKLITDRLGSSMFGIDMTNQYSERDSVYVNDDLIFIDVELSQLDLANPMSLRNAAVNAYSFIEELEPLLTQLEGMSSELSSIATYLKVNDCLERPLTEALEMRADIDCPDDFDLRKIIIDTAPSYANMPNDRVFIPIPRTKDLLAATRDDLHEVNEDIYFNIQNTYEFLDPEAIKDYVADNILKDLSTVVCPTIQSCINLNYELDKVFKSCTGLTEDEKQRYKRLAYEANNSIYKQGNIRALGIDMQPNSLAYNMLIGKPDVVETTYANERDFEKALVNLLMSTLFFEYDVYSEAQLIKAKGFIPKSESFEKYMLAQITVVMRARFASSGRISPLEILDETDDDDNEDSSSSDVLMSEIAPQLYQIKKYPSGKAEIKYPDPVDISLKMSQGEIDNFLGVPTCAGYIRNIDNWEGSILTMIQMLRFGERRNQYISIKSLSDNLVSYPYFDTETLQATRVIRVEKPFTTVKTDGGKDYKLTGTITLTKPIDEEVVQIPVGVILTKEETNGRIVRKRQVIFDTNMFVIAVTKTNSDGKTLLDIDGFDVIDGVLVYDSKVVRQAESYTYSAVELEAKRQEENDKLIVENRTTITCSKNINIFCMQAGIEQRVGDMKYTFLSALSSYEQGEFNVSMRQTPALETTSADGFIFQSIMIMYLKALIQSQDNMINSQSLVSITTLLDYCVEKMKAKVSQDRIESEENTSLFTRTLSDKANYQMKNYLRVINDNKELVGYAFVMKGSTSQYILLTAKDEMGIALPMATITQQQFPASKFLDYNHITNFYRQKQNLKEQMSDVAREHKIVLYSEETIKKIYGSKVL